MEFIKEFFLNSKDNFNLVLLLVFKKEDLRYLLDEKLVFSFNLEDNLFVNSVLFFLMILLISFF